MKINRIKKAVQYYREHGGVKTLQKIKERLCAKPMVSFVVPVYQVEKYLPQCLDSILCQEDPDFELICVNDGSTDGSLRILRQYRKKDRRIRIINKRRNKGCMLARKSGIMAAKGRYIIFVDADDLVNPRICAFVRNTVQESNADILQFTAKSENWQNNGQSIGWLASSLRNEMRTLTGNQILEEAYIKRSYTTALWGKVYKADLCKTAAGIWPQKRASLGEDIFMYFHLACFAKVYKSIATEPYYIYRFGLGVGNRNVMNLEKFERYCAMEKLVEYLEEGLLKRCRDPFVKKCADAMTKRLEEDCVSIFRDRIAPEDKEKAGKILYEYWRDYPVFHATAREWLENEPEYKMVIPDTEA